jgi:hypothetical protein
VTAARLLTDEDTAYRRDQAANDRQYQRALGQQPDIFEDARDDTPERLMPEGVIDEPRGGHP